MSEGEAQGLRDTKALAMVRTWGPEASAALVAAQGAAGDVEKRSHNAQKQYNYASCEEMIAASDVLAGAGLTLSPEESRLETFDLPPWVDGEGQLEPAERVIMLHSVYRLEHGPTGQFRLLPWDCPVMPHKGMPLDKAMAAARTYSLGYLLRDLLLLPRVEAGTDVDQRPDPPRRATPQASQREPSEPQRDAKPSASVEHFAKELESAASVAQLDELKAQIVAAGLNKGGAGTRLVRAWKARHAALEQIDYVNGQMGAPKEEDWGDKAALINRHVTDAKGLDAVEVAASELAKAQADGMPASLVAPIGMLIDAKRAQYARPTARGAA